MKRFHVHLAVKNLKQSIDFYSTLFSARPTIERADYAKWMLEDPRVNFAISERGHVPGVNHLGIQAEDADELAELGRRVEDLAGPEAVVQDGAACCYARSDKYWLRDPQGLAWEHFHTLEGIAVFGQDTADAAKNAACCVPLASDAGTSDAASGASCCVPAEGRQACS